MLFSSMIENGLNRREMFKTATGLGAGALAMTAMPQMAAAKGALRGTNRSPIDFSDSAQNLKAFVKMTGDLDPSKETAGWFGGRIFGIEKDKALYPLVDVEGFGIMRVEPLGDDRYRMFNSEIAFYKDVKTGQFIDVWKNPITGENCEVSPIHNRVVNAEVAPIIKQDFDGHTVEFPFMPPWDVLQDVAMSTFELHTAFPNPMSVKKWPKESAGPISRISEIFQRTCLLADLEDENKTSVDYAGSWNRVGPWLPWMLMGQRDGSIYYRTMTKKVGKSTDLPRHLIEMTEKRYPEYMTAPGPETWGQPNDSSFTTYMSERTPVK